MRYTIYSINDHRADYKRQLRARLRAWDEVSIECVNGLDPKQLRPKIEDSPYAIHPWPLIKVGQLGIWFSFLNALEHAPIVTFDDDAIVNPMVTASAPLRWRSIKQDFDFFSLFLPRDSDHLYDPTQDVSDWATRVYARYGGVSFYFTERGRDRIKALLKRDGIRAQYDDTLYAYAKAGELDGFCSKPTHRDLVYITGQESSLVQESESYAG